MNRPGIRLSLILLCMFMSSCSSTIEFTAVYCMQAIFTSYHKGRHCRETRGVVLSLAIC